MSRTKRRVIPRYKRGFGYEDYAPDGAPLRVDRTCGNHGSCPYCAAGRQHKFKRQAPLEERI